MHNKSAAFFSALVISAIVSCSDGKQENDQTYPSDSMPVVDPGTMDTSRVITTPPTNDQNNALPDTIP